MRLITSDGQSKNLNDIIDNFIGPLINNVVKIIRNEKEQPAYVPVRNDTKNGRRR